MADKKKRKKELKELRQQAKKAKSLKEEYQQEINRLKRDLSLRDRKIADLLRQAKSDDSGAEGGATTGSKKSRHKIRKGGVVRDQREAWKKYSYLRDRYEFYLDDNKQKGEARSLANQDLIQRYGSEYGYSEKQLSEILT